MPNAPLMSRRESFVQQSKLVCAEKTSSLSL
jgi:hypothetical protein